jgi:hypothetical protein
MPIRDLALRKIRNGFIVSHYELPYEEETIKNSDTPIQSKYHEVFVVSEKEAAKLMASLAHKMKL